MNRVMDHRADRAMHPREVVATVVDPELRVLTIEELGILRDVAEDAGRVTVTITPTYTGCPAMDAIRADITAALRAAGYPDAQVVTALHPPWSTDAITESGRAKLVAAGIAPPPARLSRVTPPAWGTAEPAAVGPAATGPVPLRLSIRCPRCGSPETQEISRFGATPCMSLWRCRTCAEPFEHVKAL